MEYLAGIWTRILRKTDLLTCLSYGDMLAAEPFLVDQQGAMDTAVAADHRIGISLLLRHGVGILSPATAARNGNLDLMQRILARGEEDDCDEDTFTEVVKKGHLDVLKWSHNNLGHQWCTFRFWLAIEQGHIGIADWMLSIRTTQPSPLQEDILRGAVETACMHGRLDMLRWLVQEADVGFEDVLGVDNVLSSAILRAASGGHLDILNWLEIHIDDAGRLNHAVNLASKGQNMGMDFFLGPSLFSRTIEGGFIDCLLWLQRHAVNIDFANENERQYIVKSVALGGHVHMLEWLQNNTNVPFTHECMDQAAGQSLETLIWFHRNRTEGCSKDAMDFAAAAGRLDVIRWLHVNRNEGCTQAAMNRAAANGNLDVVEWLHENRREGCTTAAMDDAAANGHLDIVKWLHLHREEGCTTSAMDAAAINKHMDVVVWLHENRMEGCSDTIIHGIFSAASETNCRAEPTVLDFLLEHYPEKCQGEPRGWLNVDQEEEFYSRAAAAIQS